MIITRVWRFLESRPETVAFYAVSSVTEVVADSRLFTFPHFDPGFCRGFGLLVSFDTLETCIIRQGGQMWLPILLLGLIFYN